MFSFNEKALRLYAEALSLYKQSEYNSAMTVLNKMERKGAMPFKALLLRAYIFRATGAVLSEVGALTDMLAKASPKTADEREQAADAWSLLGAACSELGENETAREAFLQAAELSGKKQLKLTELSNAIFVSNHITGLGTAEMKRLYQQYNALLADIEPYREYLPHEGALRLGILSADLHSHPVASLLLALFRCHNREKMAIYCYSATAAEDGITEQLKVVADGWQDVCGREFAEIAGKIHADAIDVLFDLSGHTANTLLPVLAYRAAPVQLSGIGYMGSTGLAAVDYFLGDVYLDDAETDEWFSEKLLRLSTTHFCFSPAAGLPACEQPPCLKNGCITFGCFNNLAKLTGEMLAAWQRIMTAVPQSRLLLKHKLLGSKEGRQYIKSRLNNAGIDLARTELRDFSTDYLTDYYDVDIALDTYPYTGGMTTFEALYMGVPVVSLYGSRHGSRFGRSILANAGVGELAVSSIADYVSAAVSLANDGELLAGLHQSLRRLVEKSPLMDGKAWTREFEELMRKAVENCRR